MSHAETHPKPVFGCDGCIALASVPIDPLTGEAQLLFRVEVSLRGHATCFVMAPSKAAAEEAMNTDVYWDILDFREDHDAMASPLRQDDIVRPFDMVWVDGDWKRAEDLNLVAAKRAAS